MKYASVLALAAALTATAGAQSYRLVDLGTFFGEAHAFGVSADDQIVGSSTLDDSHFAAAALATGPGWVLGVPGLNEHAAFGVDPSGNALGVSYTLGGLSVQSFRSEAGMPTPLGDFSLRGVNASGVIAGTTNVMTNGYILPRACTLGAVFSTLPTLGGATGHGLGIDAAGRVLGSSTTTNEAASRPCMWVGGVARDLGTLASSASATGQAWSAFGQTVVGVSQNAAGVFRATRWTLDSSDNVTGRTDLGGVGASASSFAYSINASGDAVGTSSFRAMLFRGGQAIDLNTLVLGGGSAWTLQKAWSINDEGVIVGDGSLLGSPRAFALYPCPTGGCCDSIDFNRDGLFPDTSDIDAFIGVFSGASCPTQSCGDIDFNNDGLFPDTTDIDALLSVFSGGACT